MLDSLIKKLAILFISTYILGSVVFYFALDKFYEEEAFMDIREKTILYSSIQDYVSNHLKPVIFQLEKDTQLSKDFFHPSLMSSTYIITKIDKIYKENIIKEQSHNSKLKLKFASDNPTNPINKATPFESNILKKFNSSDIKSYSDKVDINGSNYMFYAIPSKKNTDKCLACHGDPEDAPKQMIEKYGSKNGFYEEEGYSRALSIMYLEIDGKAEMMRFFFMIELLMLFIFLGIFITVKYFIVKLKHKDDVITKQSRFAAMGEMIAMIAHQWRQPLTGMGMTTNNMLFDIELGDIDNKRFTTNLETINKQIDYLSNTIDDFKDFFKSSQRYEEVDLNNIIKEACQIIQTTLDKNSVSINQKHNDSLETISTLKNDLVQIILNIINNSMDAYIENQITPKEIEVEIFQNSENSIIEISDNAGGIPKDIIDKIFDPYFSTKTSKNGTGLGLYMSKMILEDHLNGELLVKVKDSSTTFIIIIPREVI